MMDALKVHTLQDCLDEIPYAGWLGITAEPGSTLRFHLLGAAHHVGNPLLNVWHGGVLAGTLQVAMCAALMSANNLTEPPALFEQTTRYVGSSPVTKPLTIEVRIVKAGRRVGFVEAAAWHTPEKVVATAQASFKGFAD